MRYSSEPKCRKYVEGYCLLSFARKCCDKYGKKFKLLKLLIKLLQQVKQKVKENKEDETDEIQQI